MATPSLSIPRISLAFTVICLCLLAVLAPDRSQTAHGRSVLAIPPGYGCNPGYWRVYGQVRDAVSHAPVDQTTQASITLKQYNDETGASTTYAVPIDTVDGELWYIFQGSPGPFSITLSSQGIDGVVRYYDAAGVSYINPAIPPRIAIPDDICLVIDVEVGGPPPTVTPSPIPSITPTSILTTTPTDIPTPVPTATATATPQTIITGRITDFADTPLPDVAITTSSGQTVFTDAQGVYTFTGNISFPVGLIPMLEPYTFFPPERTVLADGQPQNFHGDSTLPVIFIPGISGSYLVENGEELWPAPLGSDAEKRRLSLFPVDIPSPNIVATDAMRQVGVYNIYEPLLNALVEQGHYREYHVNNLPPRRTAIGCDYANQVDQGPNLFVFAHDWRRSNGQTAQDLAEYIQCIHRFYPQRPINIIAHSMGGLAARRYILDHPTSHGVNMLITMGSPWLGAPKGIYVLATGDFTFFLASGEDIKYILKSFTGAHELLPSRAYFDLSSMPPWIESGWDIDHDGHAYEVYTYPNYQQSLDTFLGITPFAPGTDGAAFHNYRNQDNWSTDTTGVAYHHIYGIQPRDTTIGQVGMELNPVCVVGGGVSCVYAPTLHLMYTAGDGTVPVSSARRIVDDRSYNAPGARLYPITSSVDHMGLASEPSVIALIHTLLRSPTPDAPEQRLLPSSAVEPVNAGVPSYNLSIYNAAQVVVSDSLGNSTVSLSSTTSFHESVPGVDTYTLGSLAQNVLMDASRSYTVTFTTSDKPVALEMTLGTSQIITQAIRYHDVQLPPQVPAQLIISSQEVSDLRYDADGDGSFEGMVAPTITIAGPSAQDTVAPTITFRYLDGIGALAAEDTSGVEHLLYSTDGTHFVPYTQPFSVAPGQVPTMYAFAEDSVGNRSSVYTYPVGTSFFLPFIRR